MQKEQENNKKEEELLKKIEEKEQKTVHRALNPKGYSQTQNNEKDW